MCAEGQEPVPGGEGTPSPPRKLRSERREQAAVDVLRTYVRDLHEYRFGALPPASGEVDLVLRLKVRPGEDWGLRFDPPLAEQVGPQIEDARAGRDVFVDGRLYCFRCDSSLCEHSLPPSPLDVFTGYAPNGLPEWQEFAQVLVAAKDEGVDRLFQKPPGIAARVQFGHDLKERQLSSFGRASKTYSVMGQVVAGYFQADCSRGVSRGTASEPPQGSPQPPQLTLRLQGSAASRGSSSYAGGSGGGRLAVTFQVVEARGGRGEFQLKLSLVAHAPGDAGIADLLASGGLPALARALDLASAEIFEMEQRAAAARARGDPKAHRDVMREVPGVLHRLAESLERSDRQSARRTRHVEERRRQNRPVHKALEDALSASPETVFLDEKAGTTIACGAQGRAHVFNPDGRHVTSFLIGPGAIAFRLRTKRWRPATPGEVEEFKNRIREFGR